jgi:hypothetical protein
MLDMLFVGLGIDDNVINVYDTEKPEVRREHTLHDLLEDRRPVL